MSTTGVSPAVVGRARPAAPSRLERFARKQLAARLERLRWGRVTLRDADGTLTGWVGIQHDITELRARSEFWMARAASRALVGFSSAQAVAKCSSPRSRASPGFWSFTQVVSVSGAAVPLMMLYPVRL